MSRSAPNSALGDRRLRAALPRLLQRGTTRTLGVTKMNAWPFSDPENAATITVRQIVDGSKPVLLVCRDIEDGSWLFLTGGPFEMADSKMVTLKSMVDRDPTLLELADLPIGWQAYRTAKGAPWQRSQSEADDA